MRRLWSFALLPILAGCGGGGGDTSFLEGRSGSIALTFSAASGFNGNAAPLNTYTSLDGSATSKVATINATNVNRGVEAILVARRLSQGVAVDLSASNASSTVSYREPAGEWVATSGTLTLQTRTANSAQLLLTNVVLTNRSTAAAGTITLNGTMTVVGS